MMFLSFCVSSLAFGLIQRQEMCSWSLTLNVCICVEPWMCCEERGNQVLLKNRQLEQQQQVEELIFLFGIFLTPDIKKNSVQHQQIQCLIYLKPSSPTTIFFLSLAHAYWCNRYLQVTCTDCHSRFLIHNKEWEVCVDWKVMKLSVKINFTHQMCSGFRSMQIVSNKTKYYKGRFTKIDCGQNMPQHC